MDKALISGSTTLLILRLLSKKDMYGYEMIETMKSSSNHVFDLQTGTLYPLLHSLEHKGYVDSYNSNETAKVRKYYTLTTKGQHVLEEKHSEWKLFRQAMESILEGGF